MSTNQVTMSRSVKQPRNKGMATNENTTVSRSKQKREAMRTNNTTVPNAPSKQMQKREVFKKDKNEYAKIRKEQAQLMTRLMSQKSSRYAYSSDDE
jgi:hypothetical protein